MGCYNNIYEIDLANVDPPGEDKEEITGIYDLLKDGAQNINIVFIHGMGHHPQEIEYGKKGINRIYQDRLAEELGFEINKNLKELAEGNGFNESEKILDDFWSMKLKTRNNPNIVGGKLGWRQFMDKDNRTLNMFALSWDEITVTIQQSILELDKNFYETIGSRNREKDRVDINRQLKQFINRSFADPAIYLGNTGDEIRYIVAQGIEKIDKIIKQGHFSKHIQSNPKQYLDSNQVVIISDSLGSSVIFDTVKQMKSIDKSNDKFKYNEASQNFAALSTLLFMNANQLPLIELGRIEGPKKDETEEQWLNNYPCSNSSGKTGLLGFEESRQDTLKKLLNQTPSLKEKVEVPVLQVVAFTDPNDALSYYITKRFKDHCSGNKIKIVNVVLTNAVWNYFFKLANPVKAHASGFKTNDRAIEIVVYGVHRQNK